MQQVFFLRHNPTHVETYAFALAIKAGIIPTNLKPLWIELQI